MVVVGDQHLEAGDLDGAVDWYHRAAELSDDDELPEGDQFVWARLPLVTGEDDPFRVGVTMAMTKLGKLLYRYGTNDETQAAGREYLRQAAERGETHAQGLYGAILWSSDDQGESTEGTAILEALAEGQSLDLLSALAYFARELGGIPGLHVLEMPDDDDDGYGRMYSR